MPKTQEMAALAMMPSCYVKPATMDVRNDMVATVMAYGNCDDTFIQQSLGIRRKSFNQPQAYSTNPFNFF